MHNWKLISSWSARRWTRNDYDLASTVSADEVALDDDTMMLGTTISKYDAVDDVHFEKLRRQMTTSYYRHNPISQLKEKTSRRMVALLWACSI